MIHLCNKVSSKISTIMVAFDAGAGAEDGHPLGIAHMLEHMLFKGTEKRSYLDIPQEISFLGGSTNAFTSMNMVAYYISVPYDKLESAVEIISDITLNSVLPEEEFLKERKVVREEEISSSDNVSSFIYSKFQGLFFSGRSAIPVIGTGESIDNFTYDELVSFHKEFYHKGNMVVSLSSNVKIQDGKDLLERYFGKPSQVLDRRKIKKSRKFNKTSVHYIHKDGIEHSHVWHGYPGLSISTKGEEAVAYDVMLSILGSGMDSRLFSEVREKHGLCYGIGATSLSMREKGATLIHTSTRKENMEKMNELIMIEVDKMRTELVTEYELQKVKNKFEAKQYSKAESSYYIASNKLSEKLLKGITNRSYMNHLSELTREDVRDIAKKVFIDTKHLTLICNGGKE